MFHTRRTITRSSISPSPRKSEPMISAISSQPKLATTRKPLTFQTLWGSNVNQDQVSKNCWSPRLVETRWGGQPRPSFPLLHPPNPSDLNPPTTKEKGSKRARRWWKQEKATPPRKLSPKEGPNKPEQGRRRLTRNMTLKLDHWSRTLPSCQMEPPCLPTRLSGSSSRSVLVMLPMQWNRCCYSPTTWPNSSQ